MLCTSYVTDRRGIVRDILQTSLVELGQNLHLKETGGMVEINLLFLIVVKSSEQGIFKRYLFIYIHLSLRYNILLYILVVDTVYTIVYIVIIVYTGLPAVRYIRYMQWSDRVLVTYNTVVDSIQYTFNTEYRVYRVHRVSIVSIVY